MPGRTDDRYTLEFLTGWTTHRGREDRALPGQLEQQRQTILNANAQMALLARFDSVLRPVAIKLDRSQSSFAPRKQVNHFDMGLDTHHLVGMVVACAGAFPLTQIVKAARDGLVAWFKRSPIVVKFADGRSIQVHSVPELKSVIGLIQGAKSAKDSPRRKQATKKVARRKSPAKRIKRSTKR